MARRDARELRINQISTLAAMEAAYTPVPLDRGTPAASRQGAARTALKKLVNPLRVEALPRCSSRANPPSKAGGSSPATGPRLRIWRR